MKDNYPEKVAVEEEIQQASVELSEEVWIAILAKLDPESLQDSVQWVSKMFHRLANDSYIWKRLFLMFFPDEVPEPFPDDFNWQSEFHYLYKKEYGALKPEVRKLIFSIITGATEEACKSVVSLEDLQAEHFILIRMATRFDRQVVLRHFHSSLRQQLELQEEGQLPLGWAVLFNQKEVVHAILGEQPQLINDYKLEEKTITQLAAEVGHLDLLEEFLNQPGNKLNTEKIWELYHCIARSKQLALFERFRDFIENNARFAQMTKPDTSYLAGLYGAITIFKAAIIPLHQEKVDWERELNQLPPELYFSTGNTVDFAAVQQRIQELAQKFVDLDPRLFQEFLGISLGLVYKRREAILKLAKITNDDKLKHLIIPSATEMLRDGFKMSIESALSAASRHGHINIIRYALDNKLFNINELLLGSKEDCLLLHAAMFNQQKLVRFLLDRNANLELTLAALIKLRENPLEHDADIKSGESSLKPKDFSELIDLFLVVLEERKEPLTCFRLIDVVVKHNKIDLLKHLFSVDPEVINLVDKSNRTALYSAILAQSEDCISFLLANGAEANAEILYAAIRVNDIPLVQDLLARAGEDVSALVNAVYLRVLTKSCLPRFQLVRYMDQLDPIIDSLKNPEMQKLILPYIDKEKAICDILAERSEQDFEQRSTLIRLRNIIDLNDRLLDFPPIDKKKLLAFVETEPKQNTNTIRTELQYEINSGKTASNSDDLAIVELQVKAMGYRKGVNAGRRKSANEDSLPATMKLPSELNKLKVYSRLVAAYRDQPGKIKKLRSQLQALYFEAYLEGKRNSFEARSSSKRKSEPKPQVEKKAKKSKQTAIEQKPGDEQPLGKRKRNSADEKETQERKAPALESAQPSRLGMFANKKPVTGTDVSRNRPAVSASTTSVSSSDSEEGQTVYSPSFFLRPEDDSQRSAEVTEARDRLPQGDTQSKESSYQQ